MAISPGITFKGSNFKPMKDGTLLDIIEVWLKWEWDASLGSKKTPVTKISRNTLYQGHKALAELLFCRSAP